jgi:DNA-binding response OmpR family regulator
MHILVVDDEDAVVKMIGRQLQKAGYNSVCLHDPEIAITFFNQNHDALDLAIIDINMPGVTGLQMAEDMRKIEPTLPIILITGVSNDTQVTVGNNIKDVLHKPIPRDELLDTVRRSLYS